MQLCNDIFAKHLADLMLCDIASSNVPIVLQTITLELPLPADHHHTALLDLASPGMQDTRTSQVSGQVLRGQDSLCGAQGSNGAALLPQRHGPCLAT